MLAVTAALGAAPTSVSTFPSQYAVNIIHWYDNGVAELYVGGHEPYQVTLAPTYATPVAAPTFLGDPLPSGSTIAIPSAPGVLRDRRILSGASGALHELDSGDLITTSGGGPFSHASSVTGRGVDLCGTDGLVTVDGSTVLVTPLPNDIAPGIWQGDYHACLNDVTGDGLGDLLMAEYSGFLSYGYFGIYRESILTLHPGGPNGYGEAIWTLTLSQGAPFSAVALQADSDPELELAVAVGILDNLSSGAVETSIVILDDIQTAPRVASVIKQRIAGKINGTHQGLLNVGDVDNDGLDDLITPDTSGGFYTNEPAFQASLVSAATGFDVDKPLARFTFDADDPIPSRIALHTADLDQDGHLDLYGMGGNGARWQVQVWYGPLYEHPEPIHTATTGDTGTATESTATADTATLAGTAVVAPEPPPGGDEARGCGCTQRPSYTSILPTLLTRRRGAQ